MEQELWQGFRIQFQVPIDDNNVVNEFDRSHQVTGQSEEYGQ